MAIRRREDIRLIRRTRMICAISFENSIYKNNEIDENMNMNS